jgi:hypothetical protein
MENSSIFWCYTWQKTKCGVVTIILILLLRLLLLPFLLLKFETAVLSILCVMVQV